MKLHGSELGGRGVEGERVYPGSNTGGAKEKVVEVKTCDQISWPAEKFARI